MLTYFWFISFLKNLVHRMLKKILLYFFSISTLTMAAQSNSYGTGSNGVRSDGRLIAVFESIKNRTNAFKSNSNKKIKGSPYFEMTFKRGEIRYFDKDIKDNIFIRYNAHSDEMEIGKNPNQKSADNILIKNNKVSCIIDGDIYHYLGYVNENYPSGLGYFKELFRGKVFSFFEKKSKVYMEATIAKTSLERPLPDRFVEKTKYFFSVNNGSLLQIKLSKKKLISALKPYFSEIKSFISNSDLKVKNPNDVIKLFNYLETINNK